MEVSLWNATTFHVIRILSFKVFPWLWLQKYDSKGCHSKPKIQRYNLRQAVCLRSCINIRSDTRSFQPKVTTFLEQRSGDIKENKTQQQWRTCRQGLSAAPCQEPSRKDCGGTPACSSLSSPYLQVLVSEIEEKCHEGGIEKVLPDIIDHHQPGALHQQGGHLQRTCKVPGVPPGGASGPSPGTLALFSGAGSGWGTRTLAPLPQCGSGWCVWFKIVLACKCSLTM